MIADDSPTPLWKFVTDHPLVFGAEVLTKLNEFDLKIFYDLCRASREVVIRSKIKLNNERRYVSDVESMREFQLAWEHYRWGEEDMYVNEMNQGTFLPSSCSNEQLGISQMGARSETLCV